MKKILLFASLFVATAMVSYGGNTILAHAQSAPANTAALQQELDDAKGHLVKLQMEAGQVPAGDANLPSGTSAVMPAPAPTMMVTPTMTLSATDISEMNSVLTALTAMLTNLQMKIAQDPQFAVSNGASVVSGLQGIGHTLAAIVNDAMSSNVAQANPAAPVAVATPNTGATAPAAPTAPSAAMNQPTAVAQTPAVTPTTPAPAATTPVNTAPQTAQASNSFSFSKLNWPLIIVIILIVAAIAIWLWWDDSDDTKQPVVRTTQVNPQKPVQPLQPSNQVSMSSNGQVKPSSPQTPLSSAVSPQGNR